MGTEDQQDIDAIELACSPSPGLLLFSNSADTVFSAGWASPGPKNMEAVPWSTVQECMQMARDALVAKQRVAEELQKEVENIKRERTSDQLLQRAQRAEEDSGSLLEELEALIDAKSRVANQRAELDS